MRLAFNMMMESPSMMIRRARIGRLRTLSMKHVCTATPRQNRTGATIRMLRNGSNPRYVHNPKAAYIPSIKNPPCAKLGMFITPKISVRPLVICAYIPPRSMPFTMTCLSMAPVPRDSPCPKGGAMSHGECRQSINHQHSAVHVNRLSCDVLGCVAHEEGDGIGDVFRLREATQGDSLFVFFPHGVEVALVHCGFDRAWGNAVHSYPEGRQFPSKITRECMYACLRDTVVRSALGHVHHWPT